MDLKKKSSGFWESFDFFLNFFLGESIMVESGVPNLAYTILDGPITAFYRNLQ